MAAIEHSSAADKPRVPATNPLVRAAKKGTAQLALAADQLRLSTAGKLLEGNRQALRHTGQTMAQMVTHPLETLKGMARGAFAFIANPGSIVASLRETYAKDRVDGVIQSVMIGASMVGVAAAATMAVTYGAAILTGGASFAILPAAGTVASIAGAMGVGAIVASFLKNQVDIARAKTKGELAKESQELGQDYTNLGFMAASTAAAKGIGYAAKKLKPKNVNPSAAQRAATRVKGMVKDKLSHEIDDIRSAGGLKVDGKSRDTFREMAVREVQDAVEHSVQGKRPLEVADLDIGSFKGVERLGEHRMVYHGTRGDVSHLIRKNGLKPSDIGDYGAGTYFGASAKIGVNYADDVTLGRGAGQKPAVYVAEIAPGKAMDYLLQKDQFLAWAKKHFDPTDMTDPVNQLYHNPSVPVSKMVDNTWTRYLPQYAKEMGYDSILVRDWDGPGLDYWVVHDPKRIVVRQEIRLGQPENKFLVPAEFDGRILGTVQASDPKRNAQ